MRALLEQRSESPTSGDPVTQEEQIDIVQQVPEEKQDLFARA